MFYAISWASHVVAFRCAILIAVDEIGYPQKMWAMNLVWPITALYFSIFGLPVYFRAGRRMSRAAITGGKRAQARANVAAGAPTFTQAAISDLHRGAGCTLGDIIAEFSVCGLAWFWDSSRRIR